MASSVIKNPNVVRKVQTNVEGVEAYKVGKIVMLENFNTPYWGANPGDVLYTLPTELKPASLVDLLDSYGKKRIQINTDGTVVAREAIAGYGRFTVTYITEN